MIRLDRLVVFSLVLLIVISSVVLWSPDPTQANSAKLTAIENATQAFAALPSVTEVSLSSKAEVIAARLIADSAKSIGVRDTEIPNLQKLQDCENKLAELEKKFNEKQGSIQAALAAISALPNLESLRYADNVVVTAARSLVNKAKSNGASDAELANQAKLEGCEKRMVALTELEGEKVKAINTAAYAISTLPEPKEITLNHRSAVIAVRAWVEEAKVRGAADADIPDLKKLQDCEAKITSLEKLASFKEDVAKMAVVAINALPAPESITLLDKAAVVSARKWVDLALD